IHERRSRPLDRLQYNISRETVRHCDIDAPREDVTRFKIADEIHIALPEQFECLFGQFTAFVLFTSVIDQTHSWIITPGDFTHERRSRPLDPLQYNISRETVRHCDIDAPREDVTRFKIADEIHIALPEQFECLFGQFTAFVLFTSVIDQTHSWIITPGDFTH